MPVDPEKIVASFDREIDLDIEQGTLPPDTKIRQAYSTALRRALNIDAATFGLVGVGLQAQETAESARRYQTEPLEVEGSTMALERPAAISSSAHQSTLFWNSLPAIDNIESFSYPPSEDSAMPSRDSMNMQGLWMNEVPGKTSQPTYWSSSPHCPSYNAGLQSSHFSTSSTNRMAHSLVEGATNQYLNSIREEDTSLGFDFDFTTSASPVPQPSTSHYDSNIQASHNTVYERPEFSDFDNAYINPLASLLDAENEQPDARGAWEKKFDGNRKLSKL